MTQDRNQWRAYEHGNETSVSIKGGECPDWMISFSRRLLFVALVVIIEARKAEQSARQKRRDSCELPCRNLQSIMLTDLKRYFPIECNITCDTQNDRHLAMKTINVRLQNTLLVSFRFWFINLSEDQRSANSSTVSWENKPFLIQITELSYSTFLTPFLHFQIHIECA
jgi:hypothetical protein